MTGNKYPTKIRGRNLYGSEPTNLDDLARCIIAIANNSTEVGNSIVGFSWDIKYGQISNTHNCPLNGVTNFKSAANLPKNYPGWQGRVWLRLAKPHTGWVTILCTPLCHTQDLVAQEPMMGHGVILQGPIIINLAIVGRTRTQGQHYSVGITKSLKLIGLS